MYQILAFGDSITYGAWDSEGGWADRLRRDMAKKFLSRTGDYWLVYNFGVPGDTTKHALERIPPEVQACLDEGEKAVFILAFGSNDATLDIASQKLRVPTDEFIGNIKKIVQSIRPRVERILFLSITPVNEPVTNGDGERRLRHNKRIEEYNDAIKAVASQEEGEFIDCSTGFSIENFLCFDGLHPNDAGHAFIFEQIRKTLKI